MPTSLRLATPLDAPALASLGRQTFTETFVDGFQVPYPTADLAHHLDHAFDPERLRQLLADPRAPWWIAEDGAHALGFAHAGPNTLPHPDARPTHAELRKLYVARAAQGRGLGTALLEAALAWMQAHTDGPLWVGVWSGNAKAQRLYRAFGFAPVGTYQYPVGSWLDDEWIMRRPAP